MDRSGKLWETGGASLRRWALLLACLVTGSANAAHSDSAADPTQMSLEQLFQVKVYSASKYLQKTSEAPGGVSVISAAQIREMGYRTLAELLRSVRGFYLNDDRNYSYLGVRGFSRMGDYNSRVLLLLDGVRMNDSVYDSALTGTEFPLDLDLIERIEVVRGPGSSIYGSNAFFAVVNVITRRGRDVAGVEAGVSVESFGTDTERLSAGGNARGVEWLVSGSRYRSRGQDLYYPEFDDPATNNGIAAGADLDRYEHAFAKLSFAGFTMTDAYARRTKHIPTASYETTFGDSRAQTTDEELLVDLRYEPGPGRAWQVEPRVFYGRYVYSGTYPQDGVLNVDESLGEWWGAEVNSVAQLERHRLLLGAEFQDNLHQDQYNFDQDPRADYLADRRGSQRFGFYVQDEVSVMPGLRVNGGLRYDHYSTAGAAVNPRMAVVWSPIAPTTLKLLYASAFRAPNNYELYYAAEPNKANPELRSERIRTFELIAEQELGSNLRLTLDLYTNRLADLINQVEDPADSQLVFRNIGRARGQGAELEAERVWTGGARLQGSVAWQSVQDRDTGAKLNNSPEILVKCAARTPLPWRLGQAATELHYTGARETLGGAEAAAYWLASATLVKQDLLPGLELSASVYNLFDRDYADPGRPEHAQDTIAQDGRSFRLKVAYRLPLAW